MQMFRYTYTLCFQSGPLFSTANGEINSTPKRTEYTTDGRDY